MLVDEGECRVRSGEAMVVNLAVDICGICGIDKWHVTINTFLRRFRVVERQRALMGDTTFLPLVVVVEAAHPTEIVGPVHQGALYDRLNRIQQCFDDGMV